MTTIRFIGGPAHGQDREVSDNPLVGGMTRMLFPRRPMAPSFTEEALRIEDTIQTVEYQTHRVVIMGVQRVVAIISTMTPDTPFVQSYIVEELVPLAREELRRQARQQTRENHVMTFQGTEYFVQECSREMHSDGMERISITAVSYQSVDRDRPVEVMDQYGDVVAMAYPRTVTEDQRRLVEAMTGASREAEPTQEVETVANSQPRRRALEIGEYL